MAKLVDALPSGGSVRKNVQVRILFWALQLFIFVDLSLNYLRSAIKLPSVDYVIKKKDFPNWFYERDETAGAKTFNH